MEIIPRYKRGGTGKLIFNDFIYVKQKETGKYIRWRCEQRPCSGCLFTTLNIRQNYPKEPASLDELKIEGTWTETAEQPPRRFLLYDNESRGSRIIIYATDEGLNELSKSTVWYMDGRFDVVPKFFNQLYVIRTELGERAVTAVYALMEGRNQSSYEELLQVLITHCDENNISLNPGRIIQKLGLASLYKNNDEFKHFCGMLDGLAFLPTHRITEGLTYLKSIAPTEALDLLLYFSETYVEGTYRRVNRKHGGRSENTLSLTLQRIPPCFPPEYWSVYEATVNKESKTNNFCEGWNLKIKNLASECYHVSFYRMISALKSDETSVHYSIIRSLTGECPPMRKNKKREVLHTRLGNLLTDFRSGTKSLQEFLIGIGYNIRLNNGI
ncbi:uncharacterized protein LOC118200265 [Stegodyphus dumicola]|uniref:uncharacterized protein LOC118200265 n=1 Tax=Stegodyphus dumicola TaxID=202533 RepID=UPI0015ABA388|nr:uncharacterized protein LOC118200265 [Stegodyphus dumicola]